MPVKDKIPKEEILKWLGRIEGKLPGLKATGQKGEEFLTNIRAYVSDSRHFLETDDYVNAFEAVIWAWSWYEIGEELRLLSSSRPRSGAGSV